MLACLFACILFTTNSLIQWNRHGGCRIVLLNCLSPLLVSTYSCNSLLWLQVLQRLIQCLPV